MGKSPISDSVIFDLDDSFAIFLLFGNRFGTCRVGTDHLHDEIPLLLNDSPLVPDCEAEQQDHAHRKP